MRQFALKFVFIIIVLWFSRDFVSFCERQINVICSKIRRRKLHLAVSSANVAPTARATLACVAIAITVSSMMHQLDA